MGAQQNCLKAFGIDNWVFSVIKGCQGPKGQKLLPYNTQHRPTTTHFQVVANAVVLEERPLIQEVEGGGVASFPPPRPNNQDIQKKKHTLFSET